MAAVAAVKTRQNKIFYELQQWLYNFVHLIAVFCKTCNVKSPTFLAFLRTGTPATIFFLFLFVSEPKCLYLSSSGEA